MKEPKSWIDFLGLSQKIREKHVREHCEFLLKSAYQVSPNSPIDWQKFQSQLENVSYHLSQQWPLLEKKMIASGVINGSTTIESPMVTRLFESFINIKRVLHQKLGEPFTTMNIDRMLGKKVSSRAAVPVLTKGLAGTVLAQIKELQTLSRNLGVESIEAMIPILSETSESPSLGEMKH